MTRQVVEVFADVVCPFTHVGLRRIVARPAKLGLCGRCCLCGHGHSSW